jgi:hypothetical protein
MQIQQREEVRTVCSGWAAAMISGSTRRKSESPGEEDGSDQARNLRMCIACIEGDPGRSSGSRLRFSNRDPEQEDAQERSGLVRICLTPRFCLRIRLVFQTNAVYGRKEVSAAEKKTERARKQARSTIYSNSGDKVRQRALAERE